jgi:hypothetical protein
MSELELDKTIVGRWFKDLWGQLDADPSENGVKFLRRMTAECVIPHTDAPEGRHSLVVATSLVLCGSSSPPAKLSSDEKTAPTSGEDRMLGLPETRRLESLSDAAFSIIITLLVLEINRPNTARGRLREEVLMEWSSYLAYAVAFIYVGVIG